MFSLGAPSVSSPWFSCNEGIIFHFSLFPCLMFCYWKYISTITVLRVMLTEDEHPVSPVGCDAVSLDDALKVCSALLFKVRLSWPWRWRLYSTLKHREVLVHWHRVISLKTWIFSYTAFRISDLSCWLICMFSSMTTCLVCMKALRRSLQKKPLGTVPQMK